MKLLIINGPNLNLLGTREPKIYGSRTFESYLVELRQMLDGDEIEYRQSNHEGDIIDFLHNTDADAGFSSPLCRGTITGFGLNSYFLAAQAFVMGHVK